MLINVLPPPLPGTIGSFNDAGELCRAERGLSGDPFGITDVVGIVSNWLIAGKQAKIQQKQIDVQQSALKQQKVVDAENFAAQQAAMLAAPSEKKRQDQVLGLALVGVGAVLVAGLLIFGAVKKSQ